MTVCGFIDIYQKGGHKAIIHDAACSALGKMLVKFAKKKLSIPLINIIRRDEQAKILEDLGAEYILNSTSDTFKEDLAVLANKLNATVFFDAIGGEITGLVLDCMPIESTVYVYGALAGENLSYHPEYCTPWLKTITNEETQYWIGVVVKDLSTGGKIFGQVVAKTFPLSEYATAIAESNKVASQGKVILKPNQE